MISFHFCCFCFTDILGEGDSGESSDDDDDEDDDEEEDDDEDKGRFFFFKTFSMLRAVYVEMVVTPL